MKGATAIMSFLSILFSSLVLLPITEARSEGDNIVLSVASASFGDEIEAAFRRPVKNGESSTGDGAASTTCELPMVDYSTLTAEKMNESKKKPFLIQNVPTILKEADAWKRDNFLKRLGDLPAPAVDGETRTSEVITPRPITPTFGYTKEKLRRTRWVRGFTTSAETSLGGVSLGGVSWGGGCGRPYYSGVASERGGLAGVGTTRY